MSVPKLKVYRLDKEYRQSNDTDIQSMSSDELYPVVPKPLDPDLAKLLVGVEFRDSNLVFENSNYNYFKVEMKPSYNESGGVASRSLTETDWVECDGWRLDKSSLKIFIKKIPLESGGSSGGELSEGWEEEWTEYTDNSNWRCLFDEKTMTYNDSGEEIEDNELNALQIAGRRQAKLLSIELGQLFFDDLSFWSDDGSGLDDYEDYEDITHIVIGYQMYKDIDNNVLIGEIDTSYMVPFGAIYNGNKEGYANNKDYPNELIINEGNYAFKRQIYPLRYVVAQTNGKAINSNNDFHQDVLLQGNGTIEVTGTSNWIQSGDLAPKLFERITVFDNDEPRQIFKELKLNVQYTRYPMIDYKEGGKVVGKFTFSLISSYYRVSDGGENYLKYPEEVFVRFNEVDDNLGDIFDFDYKYNNISNDELIENDTEGEFENTGKAVFKNAPDGFIYKRKNILAIQSDVLELTDNEDDLEMVVDGDIQTVELPEDFYFDKDVGDYPLEVYDNGEKVWDSVSGMVNEEYSISIDGNTLEIELNEAESLPEDLMLIYYERREIDFGKNNDKNPWCMGYRVTCYEKVDYTDTFVSSHCNWVAEHLNNNPDIFRGYAIYQGTGTPEVPSSGLGFYFLESGYNIYYRDGYVVLSEKTSKILTINEAKNYAGFDGDDLDAENFRTFTTGIRANYAYYSGLINLTGALVRNYTARGGKHRYKLFDSDVYPLSAGRRLVLRNDSYMPTYFESGGRNLPDINVFEGVDLELFKAQVVTYGGSIRVNTVDNRLNSILFNFNIDTKNSWIKVYLNHAYDGSNLFVHSENDTLEGDVPIYCYYEDDGEHPYVGGNLYIGTDDVTESGFELSLSNLVKFERMESIYPEGMSFDSVKDNLSKFIYSNDNWEYDVVFELLSYRGSSVVEFLVYRMERN